MSSIGRIVEDWLPGEFGGADEAASLITLALPALTAATIRLPQAQPVMGHVDPRPRNTGPVGHSPQPLAPAGWGAWATAPF